MKTLLILFTLILLISCKHDSPTAVATTNAVLTWTGAYEVDGCGFIITIGNIQYKAENETIIPDSYKQAEPLNVSISYESLQKQTAFNCGDLPKPVYYPAIRILTIKVK